MTMDVFFDYACPYCLRAFAYLQELSGKDPDITLNFIPVEAHPRPEEHGLHTDLCAQAMYVARDLGAELWDFHSLMFKRAINDQVNIESAGVLSETLSPLLDKKRVFDALQNNIYAQKVQENNHLAYEEQKVWAVPAFRMEGKALDAKEGVGVTYQELKTFMKG